MNTKTFHFDFSRFEVHRIGRMAKESLFLKVQSSKLQLSAHTVETRRLAKGRSKAIDTLLTAGRDENLTHFVEIPEDLLPGDRIALMMVTGPDRDNPRYNLPDLYSVNFHVPERITRWYADRTFRRLGRHILHPKLCGVGAKASNDREEAIESFVQAEQMSGPWDTAISIIIQNPDLASSQAHTHAIVRNDHVAPSEQMDPAQYNRVFELYTQIALQGPAGPDSGFARIRQSTEHDGTKMTAEFTWTDMNGDPIYEKGDPIMFYDLTDLTTDWSQAPNSYATRSSRNDESLKSQTWSVDQGIPVDNKIVEEDHAVQLIAHKSKLAAAAPAGIWSVTNATPDHGLSVYAETLSYDATKYQLTIDVKNTFLRVLGSYVQFFSDVEMTKPIDNPKVPNIPDGWPVYFPKALAELFETPSKKALGTVTNVNTIMGIPMPTDPTKITIPWPDEAQATKLLFGCAGTSRWDNHIVWPGFIITGIFQFGIPLLFMAIGAAVTDTQWYKDFVKDTEKVITAIAVAFGPVSAGVATGAALGNTKSVLFSFAGIIVGLLVKKGMEALAAYVAARMLAAQMVNAAPIVGWGFRVAAIALNVSQIAVSTGEILSSPAVLEIDIKREMTIDFTLKPDPKHGEPGHPDTAIWPSVAYNAVIIVNYENGTTYRSEQELPATSSSKPLRFAFSPVGWGGKLQITANVFSKNGWLCGKYQSPEMPAIPTDPGTAILVVEGSIKEQLVPLTLDTQYDYKQQVFYTDQQQHHWITGTVPVETQSALSCSNVGNNLCQPVSLTINQQAFQIGYTFRASGQNLPLENPKGPIDQGQMFTMQSISVLSSEQMQKRLKFPTFGFKVQPNIAYNTWGEGATPDTINNDNFILDSRNSKHGEYHLRQVMLMNDEPNFGLDKPNLKSWGRFYIPDLDAIVVHPSRLVIAVSWKASKIQILQLPPEPVDDKDAPEAQIVSSEGILEGLTHGPIAIAISPDGRVMLLETLNKRIQAFDTKGNPVPSFPAELLLTLPAAAYVPDLDAKKFSAALQQQFRDHEITHVFDLNPAIEPELQAAKLTKKIVDAFADEGVYLTYNVDEQGHIDPTGSSFITVVTPDQFWKVTDPNKNLVLDVIKKGGALQVYDILNNVTIDVIGKGQRWVIHDLTGSNSYLAYVDPANAATLRIHAYHAYMPLHRPEGMTYVDMAIEAKGYIYVLSHKDTGGVVKNTDYALDIYNPDGSFLVRTPDPKLHTSGNMQYVSAARIAVDIWRNLFALNYKTFKGPGGRTEPSVSQWIPTPPMFDIDNTTANFNLFKTGDMGAIRIIFADHKITLSTSATIKTISADGHWSITDGTMQYDVIASVDKIYVYDIST